MRSVFREGLLTPEERYRVVSIKQYFDCIRYLLQPIRFQLTGRCFRDRLAEPSRGSWRAITRIPRIYMFHLRWKAMSCLCCKCI